MEVALHARRFTLGAVLAAAALAASPALAAVTSRSHGSDQGVGAVYGFGAGVLLPEGALADFNDSSWFVESRSLYVEKIFGGRAAAYYGETSGSNGASGGRVYGFDFDFLVKFGSPKAFGYVFAGAGYGSFKFTAAGPSGSTVSAGGYDWCWTGGIGFSFRKTNGFYLEASYVSYETNPHANFIPIVIGYQF
jgi:hypothetical protein